MLSSNKLDSLKSYRDIPSCMDMGNSPSYYGKLNYHGLNDRELHKAIIMISWESTPGYI